MLISLALFDILNERVATISIHWHPTRGIRIGEASKPGPPKCIDLSSLVSQPKPAAGRITGETGHAIPTGIERDPASLGEYSFRVSTANSTDWGPLQEYLKTCGDDVVVAQEHHLPAQKATNATQWARRNGWQPFWGEAILNDDTGGTSRGTAVFVRDGIGARNAHHIVHPSHRFCGPLVRVPGGTETLICSTYLQSAVGLNASNIDVVHKLGIAKPRGLRANN